MKPRETAALLLLSLVWGSAFLFNRAVVQDVSPLTVVAGRLMIATIVLVPATTVPVMGVRLKKVGVAV